MNPVFLIDLEAFDIALKNDFFGFDSSVLLLSAHAHI